MHYNVFNKLQNIGSMDIEDVINSHQSPLVDFVRDLINTQIYSKTIKEHFKDIIIGFQKIKQR